MVPLVHAIISPTSTPNYFMHSAVPSDDKSMHNPNTPTRNQIFRQLMYETSNLPFIHSFS